MKFVCAASLVAAALALAAFNAAAQNFTVSGYISDESSGESLISAALLDGISGMGTVTNNYGFYTLTLPAGDVSLEYFYMGYSGRSLSFRLVRDTVINMALKPSAEKLSGASVTASRSETGVLGTQMSAIEIPVHQIRNVPALAGEVDVIKAIQLLPGVQSGTEGSAGLYVRGGGPDENLLLLDGVPVYNVNHMMGFFSVFNADAIKNVTLYKGSFPARYGSRLSSILDVRMKDGNDREYHGSASVGLLAARLQVEGPVIKGRTTFNVSARRTYFDVLSLPLMALIQRKEESRVYGGYCFYDLNAKLTHRFSGSDKLYLSCYMGDDRMFARIRSDSGLSESRMNLGWNWGNVVASGRWNHVFGPRLFVNTSLNYTRYRHDLDMNLLDRYGADSFGEETEMEFKSLINDISAAADFEYEPSPEHDIRFGAACTRHAFRPAVTTIKFGSESQEGSEDLIDTTFGDRKLLTGEASIYFEDNWTVARRLKINMGMRCSMYATDGRVYHSLEPRLSLRALISGDLSLKASWSRMSQAVHLLSNSNLSLPTDLWVPVTGRIEPMSSNQVAAGVFYSLGVVDFSLEAYYKTMNNVLEYRDGASFLGSGSGWEEKVAVGTGWSYGVEFLVQKKTGKLTGWLGYTWAESMRRFDREGYIINMGNPFPAKYDRRHDLSVTASYELGRNTDVAATFIYGTGVCGSLATRTISVIPSYARSQNVPLLWTSPVDYLEGRNNYRMPSYQRFDIGVNFKRSFHNGHRRTISVSVYNVFNRNNPFMVYRDGNKLKQLSLFPIMPSMSYTYEF